MQTRFLIPGALMLLCLGPQSARPAAPTPDRPAAIKALAGRIDHWVEAGWKQRGLRPVPLADDAAFLRRVSLDLAGVIPTITQVRDFLDDRDPDKRGALAARLLRSPNYARHSAALHALEIIPQGRPGRDGSSPLRGWLEQQITRGVGHDRIVRDIVAGRTSAGTFDQAAEFRPENLAGATTRAFLGFQLECAQCHDHPFAHWKRKQFWELAAFFVNVRSPLVRNPEESETAGFRREITIPGTTRKVQARFTDGSLPRWGEGDNPRAVLADWVVSPSNASFARAAVNRLWARFFAAGLVEPLDGFDRDHACSHPELLDELADAFIRSRFDERFVAEAIVRSRAYALASTRLADGVDDPRAFARAAVRGLTPEQLFDSYRVALGQERTAGLGPDGRPLRQTFLARFPTQDRPAEGALSPLQALFLMNGAPANAATRPESNAVLEVLWERAPTHPERCIDELFMTVLTRRPRAEERVRLVRYVRASKDPRKALADVYWALLNSVEFLTNH